MSARAYCSAPTYNTSIHWNHMSPQSCAKGLGGSVPNSSVFLLLSPRVNTQGWCSRTMLIDWNWFCERSNIKMTIVGINQCMLGTQHIFRFHGILCEQFEYVPALQNELDHSFQTSLAPIHRSEETYDEFVLPCDIRPPALIFLSCRSLLLCWLTKVSTHCNLSSAWCRLNW